MANVEYKSYHDIALTSIKEAEERSLLAVGILAKADAMLLAPVDSGKLRQSIDYQVESDKVKIGSYSEYSVYVEKGTGIYAEDNNGRKTPWVYYDNKKDEYVWTKGSKPQPFITPAVDKNKKKIITLFEEELMKLGYSKS